MLLKTGSCDQKKSFLWKSIFVGEKKNYMI